ncbi:MAG: hypothetical protein QXW20_08890 [Ignisphaera sp.]
MQIEKYLAGFALAFELLILAFCVLQFVTAMYTGLRDVLITFVREYPMIIIITSAEFIIFEFVFVPDFRDLVSRAKRIGFSVNDEIVDGYIIGCITVVILSTIEIILTALNNFINNETVAIAIVANLASIVFSSFIPTYYLLRLKFQFPDIR